MAGPYCHDTGWVCEDHPDRSMHHPEANEPTGICGGAGRPCDDYRCLIPKNPPPLPPGWQSIINVNDGPQGLVRTPWNGTQLTLAQCWTLVKDGRTALCQLMTHPFAWELWLTVSGELVRSQVCRESRAAVLTAADWRAAFLGKGRH